MEIDKSVEKFVLPPLNQLENISPSFDFDADTQKVRTRFPDFQQSHPDPKTLNKFMNDSAMIDLSIGFIFSRPTLHIPMPISPLEVMFYDMGRSQWVTRMGHSTGSIRMLYGIFKCYTLYPEMLNDKSFTKTAHATRKWFTEQYTLYELEFWDAIENESLDQQAFNQLVIQHTYDLVHLLEHALFKLFIATHPHGKYNTLDPARFYTRYVDPTKFQNDAELVHDFFEKKQIIKNKELETFASQANQKYTYSNWFTLPPQNPQQLMAEYFAFFKEMAQ